MTTPSQILVLSFLLTFLGLFFFLNIEGVLGKKELENSLMGKLTKVEVMSPSDSSSQLKSSNAIYVLGGSQDSLQKKFKLAADLYHQGKAAKILILSRPGFTEYSPLLRRNFTNDEWTIEKLTGLGIPKEDIEPVGIERGIFGTFSEARTVVQIALKRGYRSVILVAAPSHTMRAWLCFSKFLQHQHLNLYVYMSDDQTGLRELLLEYLKLMTYKIFLL